MGKAVRKPAIPGYADGWPHPSEPDYEFLERICIRLSNGESLTKITKDEGMPPYHVVKHWVNTYPDAYERYARARLIQADHSADTIIDVVDAIENNYDIPKARLLIEAHQWRAAKLAPRKYGQRSYEEREVKMVQKRIIQVDSIPADVRAKLKEALQKQISVKTIEHDTSESFT